MYKLKRSSKVNSISILPNYITLLCGIILVTIITGRIYVQYLIPLSALMYFILVKNRKIGNVIEKEIFIFFGVFICIQLLGLSNNFTTYSIKNILASGSTCMLIYTVDCGNIQTQKNYIKIYYVVACMACIYMLLSNSEILSRNTMSGYFTFFYLILVTLIVGEKHSSNEISKKNKDYKVALLLICSMLPAVLFSFLLSARTALFVILLVVFFYLLFYIFDFKGRTYRRLFGLILFFVVVGLTIYINAKNYSWYTALNDLSLQYFGKNIDSSRSYLWQTSLAELSGLKWIFGLGTGITPSIERYLGSSFHNSFIQTLMQNGIIGLLCLILVFWTIWKNIVQIHDRSLRALFMAAFIAVVAYNCMECSLLQNKTFLGMIQWILLFLGVHYSHILKAGTDQENFKITENYTD